MANFSDWAESGILNFLFRGNSNSFGAPANVSIALCSTVPTEAQNGATIPELPNAGSYARYNLGAPGNSDWTEVGQVAGSGGISNPSEYAFPAATSDWGMVSGMALVTSNTWGAGEVIMWGQLVTPRDIRSGDTFKFNTGQLGIYLG